MAEQLLDPEIMKRLEQLTMVSRKISTGRLKGERRSRRRGSSNDFADFRNYVPGDDLRFLDWKIYGRLERLFLKHLHSTPSRYYLKLRLDRARRLLKQTSRSIVEITSMCGFVSTTHFSRCYRKYMGVSPKSDRAQGVPEVYQIFESDLPPEGAELAS